MLEMMADVKEGDRGSLLIRVVYDSEITNALVDDVLHGMAGSDRPWL
jgi:hypothetical protein